MGPTIALVALLSFVSDSFAYTKPVTYSEASHSIIFQQNYLHSPHSWVIVKAISLLRTDGYGTEADVAQKYLLPMLEGVTFNDVWGDADLAGGSILDYYVPDSSDDFSYGCAGAVLDIFAYKNCTDSFKSHSFYLYGNAAEEAQYRYDYARRVYLGLWGDGTDPRDTMAGWVIDTFLGQDDPQDGRWASGASAIDAATAPDGTQSRFGTGQTPAMALLDLLQNNSSSQVVFPAQSEDALSKIFVPTTNVLENHGPGWLDDRFGNADDVEAYNGYDGHGFAVYANWTLDAKQHCNGGTDCDSPMIVRLPVGSKAHAFFQLGWAIHLLEDNTTPVHTTDDGLTTAESHNDVESVADAILIKPTSVNAGVVKDLLPALNSSDFGVLYDFPPTGQDSDCISQALNPANFYKTRWYADGLTPQAGEGVAHAYTRQSSEIVHQFMPYIECIDTEENKFTSMGYFTVLGLDLAVKSTAGLIRTFIEQVDKTPPTITIVQPTATSYPHSGTLTLGYSASDDESGVKSGSVTATLDGAATVGVPPHGLASGQVINLLTEMTIGNHAFQVKATDNAGNVASPSVTFSVVVTAASIVDDVNYFLAHGGVTSKNEGNSLLQKLKAAAAYRAAGDCNDASATYQAFINELNAQKGKTVTPAAVTIMIADAQYLISHCP